MTLSDKVTVYGVSMGEIHGGPFTMKITIFKLQLKKNMRNDGIISESN